MATRKPAAETVDEGPAGALDPSITTEEESFEFGNLDTASGSVHVERAGIDYAALRKMREPFADAEVGKLPKPIVKTDASTPKFECRPGPSGNQASADGIFCGGRHARSIHLDFVGHAALTNRFLNADPTWNWEPMAWSPDGLPAFDRSGGLWIKLTIGGVTRPGYGDSQGKTGPNAIKEAIGDALRNAGMRFGGALNLWHKGDLVDTLEQQGKVATAEPTESAPARATRARAATNAPAAAQTAQAAAPTPQTGAEQPAQQAPQQAVVPPDANDLETAVVPKAPQDWRDQVNKLQTREDMGALYEIAEVDGWWTPLVAAYFTKHSKELAEAAQKAANDAVNGGFTHPEA